MGVVARLAGGSSRQAYLLLILAVAFWGGNAVAARLAVGHVSPMAIVCLRWFVVVLVLLPLVRRDLSADLPELRRHLVYLFVMGAFGFTVFNALFYWSAKATTAINMGVIQGLTPAVVIALSFFFYGTPIRALQVIGCTVALAGVAVVTCRGDLQVLREFAFNRGDLGVVGSAVLFGAYTVALRRRPAVAPFSFFAALALAAFVSSVPLLGWEVATGQVIWPSGSGWVLILYVAILPSLVSQVFFIRGVELIGAARAGLFMNLVPVFAALGGVALLGETFAPFHAVAFALVLGGIWLAERRAPQPEASTAAGSTGRA